MAATAYAHKPQIRTHRKEEQHMHASRRRRLRRGKVWTSTRILLFCAIPLCVVLLYVGLMASLTAQTYRLAAEQRTHAKLVERAAELRSQVAQLESVERLQRIARQLHMGEPSKVAAIALPVVANTVERRTAFFDRIGIFAHWLTAR